MPEQTDQNGPALAGYDHPCLAVVAVGTLTGLPPLTCGKVDKDKPMCFRGEDWCCDNHRKLVAAQRGENF